MPSETVSQKTIQKSQWKRLGRRKHEMSCSRTSMTLVAAKKRLLKTVV
jgi:hypothetical protein